MFDFLEQRYLLWAILGYIPRWVKPKTIKLVFEMLFSKAGSIKEWHDMSTCGLFFQRASTKKIQNSSLHIGLLQNRHQSHLSKGKLFLTWFTWKIVNQQSLNHSYDHRIQNFILEF